jgi:hypothetical protein
MAQAFETEHFFIEHAHWNDRCPFNIQPKAQTQAESDRHGYMLPPIGSYNSGPTAESLIGHLNAAEAWYVANKSRVIKSRQAPTSTPEERRARYAEAVGRNWAAKAAARELPVLQPITMTVAKLSDETHAEAAMVKAAMGQGAYHEHHGLRLLRRLRRHG